ncbi:hypothetical protein PEBR_05076 [Penicillium brasilianum]|uniref:Uncharacterized protein n=1 Tax=Penicillium brasilianum TaxID=104259 RepID=A0A1S9RXD6_PENBI|nr:hypothetical protein PEBR_05076 [Penicillium brasilianum]
MEARNKCNARSEGEENLEREQESRADGGDDMRRSDLLPTATFKDQDSTLMTGTTASVEGRSLGIIWGWLDPAEESKQRAGEKVARGNAAERRSWR